jgi:shikimate 5-dehydrogenase
MQNVAEMHDTLVSAASGGPLGPGVVCVVHGTGGAAEAIAAAGSATAQTTIAGRIALRTAPQASLLSDMAGPGLAELPRVS